MDVNYPTAENSATVNAIAFTNSNKEVDAFLADIKHRSDKLMNYFLAGFFVAGILLSFFYDTLEIAMSVGILSLVAYYSTKLLLPRSTLYQYVLSAVFGIFMAQFIFQMHGLFEMHFVAFIGSAILITYQNWKLQIPIATVVVVHHALFGYLQFIGYDEIYFTQLDYMDLQTFAIHAVLAAIIFFICGLWAHHLKKYSSMHIEQTFEVGRLQEEKLKQEELFALSEDLKISNAQLNEAQQMASIGSWMWDLETGHVDRSVEFYNILQRNQQELGHGPQGFLACMHPEERDAIDSMVKQSIIDDVPFVYEARLIMPDNKEKTIFAQGKAIKDENGTIIKMHGTIQDISKRKAYEQVLERTNKELRKSNHELDKFVYSVSHDLRAPLLSMQGVVEITADETQEELTATHMQMLKGSINRLDSFVAEILDYSRNARGELKLGDINFKKIITEITDDLKYMAAETKNVKIDVNIDQEDSFCSDEGRLRVVMNNLVSNAIRYHDPNAERPFVNISANFNGHATIEIEDNGIGIPEEYQQKIFDMFYRVSERSKGSGLGLYIVKETLDKLNGDIRVESTPGKGTKFTIHIPNMTLNS